MRNKSKRLILMIAVVMLVFTIRVDATSPKDIKMEGVIDNKTSHTSFLNIYDDSVLKLIKDKLNVGDGGWKDDYFDYVEMEVDGSITTTRDDNYLVADILYSDSIKGISHVEKFIYMDGEVVYKHIKNGQVLDEKTMTTKQERDLIDGSGIDYNYWNDITYKKSGKIKFTQPGYYLVSVKDSNYEQKKGHLLLNVQEEKAKEKIEFVDVKKGSWYYDDVYESVGLGIVEGIGWGFYDPDGILTVAEALTLSSRVHARDNSKLFITGGPRWFSNSFEYTDRNNILGDILFDDYEREITREEMAYIFSRTLDDDSYTEINKNVRIADLNKAKYKDEITKLYKSGIVNGRGGYDGFDPKAIISRAEVAAIVNRIVNENNRKTIR